MVDECVIGRKVVSMVFAAQMIEIGAMDKIHAIAHEHGARDAGKDGDALDKEAQNRRGNDAAPQRKTLCRSGANCRGNNGFYCSLGSNKFISSV